MHILEDTVLVAGLLFWLGLLFVPQFRSFLALLLSPIPGPLLAVSGVLALFVISFVTTMASIFVNRHFVDEKLRQNLLERTKALRR
jgi:uncharacterized membrane protein (DUF106 family)